MLKQMMDQSTRLQASKEDEMRKGFLKSVSKLNFEALAMFNKAGTGERVKERHVDVAEPRVVVQDESRAASPVQPARNSMVQRHQYCRK
jgi:hypothetical protein